MPYLKHGNARAYIQNHSDINRLQVVSILLVSEDFCLYYLYSCMIFLWVCTIFIQ
jgi:hypothetical protein